MSPDLRARTLTRPHTQDTTIPDVWRSDAACLDVDPDLFFEPAGGESAADKEARVDEAKAACAACPVLDQCLADAAGDRYAIRGGMTPDERTMRPAARKVPPSRLTSTRDRVVAQAKQGVAPAQIARVLGLNERSVYRYIKQARDAGDLPRPTERTLDAPTADHRCGTYAGAQAHTRRGEEQCAPCHDAAATFYRNRKSQEVAA